MKHSLLLFVLLLVPLVASAEITSADLKLCPDGHTTLKDVPIIYGLPPGPSDVVARHVRRFDYILGGCTVTNGDPQVQPTCTTCRFRYQAETESWTRHSPNARSFRRSFSPMLLSLTRSMHPHEVSFWQEVRAGRVVAEGITYGVRGDPPALKSVLDRWFQSQGIHAT